MRTAQVEAAAGGGEIGLESWEVGGKVFAGCARSDVVVRERAALAEHCAARLAIGYLDGMGYELHITRGANWHDEAKEPITLDEWIAYVKSDPEMRLDGFAEATLDDGSVFRTEDPSLAVWVAYSRDGVDGGHAWMWHFDGNVQAKNPDPEIVAKMSRIAQALHARLVGDEGEEYGPNGKEIRAERPKSLWKRLFG